MRSLSATVLIAVLAGSTPPLPTRAAPDVPAALDGHWNCTGPGVPPTQRTYFTARAHLEEGVARPREVFSAAERVESDGRPSTSFEHIVERPDRTLTVQSADGNGTAPSAGTETEPLRFAGRSADDTAPFTLTYAVESGMLHRTATRGGAVIDDERCTREPSPPVAATCEHPNVPAAVVHAVEPDYPAAAAVGTAKPPQGTVQVRVVLDDRSRVLWTEIARSDNAAFDETARLAARDSTYRTAVRDCRPVPAIYTFIVDFMP